MRFSTDSCQLKFLSIIILNRIPCGGDFVGSVNGGLWGKKTEKW